MSKAKQFDTVALLEPIEGTAKGEKGAVVEVYSIPYEAYDIEIVTDDGETKALLNAVRPQQIEVVEPAPTAIRFASIEIEDDAAAAAISFTDGRRVKVEAQDLYALTA